MKVIGDISVYYTLESILYINKAVDEYVIYQSRRFIGHPSRTIYQRHKRISMQYVNKRDGFCMFVIV